MRKIPIILMFAAGIAWGQSDSAPDGTALEGAPAALLASVTSIQDLDLGAASIHQAGPSSFYVRSVGIGGSTYSLTFSQDASGIWTLTSIDPERDNVLPPDTILDFASLTATDDRTIKIDGVFVDGEVYAGSLSVGDDAGLSLAGQIESGNVDAVNEARTLALAELAVTETASAFRDELEKQRLELEDVISRIEAQRDDYKSERDALSAERDSLAAERDSLADQLATMTTAEEAGAEEAGTAEAGGAGEATSPATSASPVTDDQVASLLKERDQLAGELVGVAMENNDLRDRNKTLAEQISDLQTENERLRTELSDMTAEVNRLTELVNAYKSVQAPAATAGESPSTPASPVPATTEAPVAAPGATPVWTVPGDYLRKADLEAAAAAVTAELNALETRVADLEAAARDLAALEEALRTGVGAGIPPVAPTGDQPGALIGSETKGAVEAVAPAATPAPAPAEPSAASVPAASPDVSVAPAASGELAAVSAELAALVDENAALRQEALELENKILNDILANGLVAMMKDRVTDTLRSGFIGSEPDIGTWEVAGGRAAQTDSDAFFAKLSVPAAQSGKPVLYSFRVRSLDPEGWVGVGLHLFVSDVEKRRGYGMGKSLLVWFTRDPDVYKTRLTYLQLYRSDDDINMGRVLDSVIEEPMNEFMEVEVLYEPDNQYLTVAVDGEDKVRYRTWFGIDAGVEVALRTLGAAEFRDLRIMTEPSESASVTGIGPITW